jgi:glycosyltransferase involved in cell wall biosynthesis
MVKISLIIPSKNESESLEKVILEAEKFNFINEIIVVVDNHADTLINVIKNFNIKRESGLIFSFNYNT